MNMNNTEQLLAQLRQMRQQVTQKLEVNKKKT